LLKVKKIVIIML